MKKPLELHVYEKHAEADAYRVGGFYSPYALVGADKRFADAELAACYWQSCYDYEGWDDNHLTGDAGYHHTLNQWGEPENLVIESQVFKRFATLPHYDEVAAVSRSVRDPESIRERQARAQEADRISHDDPTNEDRVLADGVPA